ncbi:MAG: adenosylmethionine--8-amino-7-oxononanoate transaminase [bacterium]
MQNESTRSRYQTLDRQSLWHPYTRFSALKAGPLPVITHGEGVYLYDDEGQKYLDAISSWWACNLGHGHPAIVEAIIRQTRELQHSILGNLSHPRAIELASMIVGLFPDDRRVMFASDGSCAVEAALKIALQYWYNMGQPHKQKFVSLDFAYHGDTLGAVSVGYLDQFHKPFKGALFPVFQAPSPCCGTCAFHEPEEACLRACFDTMRTIVREHAHELAAVIIEPMCQGSGGMRIHNAEYLRSLAELCQKEGVLLIADEIAVGMGRTGKMFAFEHAGIVPDIVCIGKSLSAGYLPISAAVVRDAIYETFRDQPEDHTFYHGHTFAGNPIAAAAAIATLRVYEEEGIVAQSAAMARVLTEELSALAGIPGVRNIRSLGMIGVVELEDDSEGTGTRRAIQVRDRLRANGILLRPLGPVIYVMPPLVIPEPVLRYLVQAIGKVIRDGEHHQ